MPCEGVGLAPCVGLLAARPPAALRGDRGTLVAAGKPADAVTLGELFELQDRADDAGGSAYFLELASTTPSAANVVAYAEIVVQKSRLRQTIDIGDLSQQFAANQGALAQEPVRSASALAERN